MLGWRVLIFVHAIFVIVCLSNSCFGNESSNTFIEEEDLWQKNVDTLNSGTGVSKRRVIRAAGLGSVLRKAAGSIGKSTNSKRKGQPPSGQSYHPSPDTKDITAFPGLEPQKRKNPVQGGGGLRARWKDSKGRNIYEWDSMHGELEKYRASDGKHLGSFDPKTGNQNKGPDPKKDLDKKYL